jgi:glyoxylase-like metal-dependent hydrolase (beta-lactamase superfamily II)
MTELAPRLTSIPGVPRDAFNVHLVGGVIVDAATRHATRRILRAVRGRTITAHAVTHGHCDHQGSSAALVAALGVPFWAPAGEAPDLAAGDLRRLGPSNTVTLQMRAWAGPAVGVDRELREGDELDAGFIALETPGHSPGHLSY